MGIQHMLTRKVSPKMIREWKDTSATYRPLLCHNKKTGPEILAYLTGKYPARELPIEGVTSALILKHMTSGHGVLSEKSEICPFIMKHPPEILVTMGAGDIEGLAEDIISLLSNE